MTWDDYLHASTLIQTDSLRTLSAGVSVRYLGELSYDWSLINTISVIGVIPMLLLFFFFQKHLVKGLVQGAVKGYLRQTKILNKKEGHKNVSNK